jgi:hypothetical protein
MTIQDVLFRASSVGKIMTDARSGTGLSETAKTYCKQLFREIRYGRRKEVHTKYMEKGLMCEEDGITLYCRLNKKFFRKNEATIKNEFICGTPDLFEGDDIRSASVVIDIKSSWDLFTFPFPTDPVNKDYYWQLQAYMALTGADVAKLVYCLIDTPLILMNDEKRKLMYRMGAATSENEEFEKACEELERNMTFSDIPMNERVCEYTVERNDKDIQKMYDRVDKCRAFLADQLSALSKAPEHELATEDIR